MRFCSDLQWIKPCEWVDPTTFPPAPTGGWHLGFSEKYLNSGGTASLLGTSNHVEPKPNWNIQNQSTDIYKKAVNVNVLASDQIPAELMALPSASAFVFGSWHKVVRLFLEKQAVPKRGIFTTGTLQYSLKVCTDLKVWTWNDGNLEINWIQKTWLLLILYPITAKKLFFFSCKLWNY